MIQFYFQFNESFQRINDILNKKNKTYLFT